MTTSSFDNAVTDALAREIYGVMKDYSDSLAEVGDDPNFTSYDAEDDEIKGLLHAVAKWHEANKSAGENLANATRALLLASSRFAGDYSEGPPESLGMAMALADLAVSAWELAEAGVSK